MADSKMKTWFFLGVTLLSQDYAGAAKGGVVSLDDLEEFVSYLRRNMPDTKEVLVHGYGLRAFTGKRDPGLEDPRLEWRDWD